MLYARVACTPHCGTYQRLTDSHGRQVRRCKSTFLTAGRSGAACYHPAGATLASGSEDEQVRLWCVGSEAADVGGAAEGPGTVFACAQILDVDRGTQEEEVLSLAYSADGGYLVTGQSDHAVHMWCVQSASSSV